MKQFFVLLAGFLVMSSCNPAKKKESKYMKKVDEYAIVKLTADISDLSENQREMLILFIEAAQIMDEIFWMQAYGNKYELLDTLTDPALKKFVEINYGPWERLDGNKPFIEGVQAKPAGANFYPSDMTAEEFDVFDNPLKSSQYSLIRRDSSGDLVAIPYHLAYAEQVKKAASLLDKASTLAADEGFKKYLELRAEALLTDNYQPSDMAWMDMKTNRIDFVLGPIENYEDQLYGRKAAHEAYILLKDMDWSEKLNRFSALLPELQKKLPVNPAYKSESPGSGNDLAAYDVLFYAGDCNAGSKTIAINLPNDEQVQLEKGSRRLQLKNAMHAKFDKILVPISEVVIAEDQRNHISFDAFFSNTMFHEVAHGLGIKNTIDGTGTVREALKDQYVALEEGKADILGLFLVTQLNQMGETESDLADNYTTFLAGIFRSIRFGSSSAHGKANLIRFNYFKERGAFIRDKNGFYSVEMDAMQNASDELTNTILTIQGNGDYEAAGLLVEKYGILTPELQEDLEKINSKGIPVDIVFEQGVEVLGL
jgi:hypothetical protein